MSSNGAKDAAGGIVAVALAGALVIALICGIFMGGSAAFGAFNRSQNLSDAKNQAQKNLIQANNQVAQTQIQIQNQAQQIQVAKQQAQIKYEDAVGVRESQDEIAKTLTPIYVQYLETQAMQSIAESGKNNTVIYVPSGQGGVPTITANAGTGQ